MSCHGENVDADLYVYQSVKSVFKKNFQFRHVYYFMTS